jgi:hypothetical protein
MCTIYNYLRTNLILGCTVLSLLSLASCKKFLNPSAEQGSLQSTTVFTTDATATSAVEGIYSSMMYNSLGETMDNGSQGVLFGLASDELNEFSTTFSDWFADQFNYSAAGFPVYTMWSYAYNSIYQANAAIEGMTAATALDDSVKKQLLGECYFLRAFHYFELFNMYGAVPLTTSSNYSSNASLTRSDSSLVYQQIVSDLQTAKSLLTTTYPSASEVRANFYVAQALLARVYLYQQKYALAQAEADSVLAGPYRLPADIITPMITAGILRPAAPAAPITT